MRMLQVRVIRAASLLGLLSWIAVAPVATALDIDFENPPYTAGATIIGQDGWDTNAYVLADPFFGGSVNGTVEITNISPLAGAQSVLYNQTVVLGGVTGASDVGKSGILIGREDGTSGADLTASFLLQIDANSVGSGSMGFFLGQGGRSPAFLRIDNVTNGGVGDILVGQDNPGPVLSNVGTYGANDIVEFTIGVDLDNQNYDVFLRNETAGTAATQLIGAGPNGRFPFFGGSISDDGDGVTYTLDASLILRSGTGRIDGVTLTSIPEPASLALIFVGLIAAGMIRRVRS